MRQLRIDRVRIGQRLGRPLETGRLVGVKGEQRLARPHWITWLDMHLDACASLHGILLACAAGAQPPGGGPDRERWNQRPPTKGLTAIAAMMAKSRR